MIKKLAFLCLSFPLFAAAQTACPLTPLRKVVAKLGASQTGCVRTLGIVDYIKRFEGSFLIRLKDKRGNTLDVIAADEPFTNEVMEVWGTLDSDSGTLLSTGSKMIVLHSQSRKRCNPCAVRK